MPPDDIPDLVDAGGNFRNDMVRASVAMFFRPAVRGQLAKEIEAQFEAFRKTGLPLDHVNAHKHFHLHPTIANTILNQTGQAIEGIATIMAVYLTVSLSISLFMNWYNRRIALKER